MAGLDGLIRMGQVAAVPPVRAGRFTLEWGRRTLVMGIVNCSPDSFSGDGALSAPAAVEQGLRFVADGADLLDVGGESTRPGALPVSADEERQRILPVIAALARDAGVPVSVDTYKSAVAAAALEHGATIVNDVSGFQADAGLPRVAAAAGAAVVVAADRRYAVPPEPLAAAKALWQERLLPEAVAGPERAPGGVDGGANAAAVLDWETLLATLARWQVSLDEASRAGLDRRQIILDPGLGLGIRTDRTLALLRRLPDLRRAGRPVLVGPSRKGFLGDVLGGAPVGERLEGTLAAVALAIAGGADVVRVHDVRAVHRVRLVADAICRQIGAAAIP